MNQVQVFEQVIDRPSEYCWLLKTQSHRKIIGSLCSYTPEEIIHAAGALPFRIFGHADSTIHADGHLQAYCCSLARTTLEQVLSRELDFLDGTVFPHTCDTMQRLSDIWRLNSGLALHFDVVLPAKLNSESAFRYLIDVCSQFKNDLEAALGVKITNQQLSESIRLYNRIRLALEELYRLRSQHPRAIPGETMDLMLRAAMRMDREEFYDRIMDVMDHLKSEASMRSTNNIKRLMLVGGVCDQPGLYGAVEQAGGAVVWDDLCVGSRYLHGMIDEDADPIEAIAKRYFERVICPAKHRDPNFRGEYLVRIAREKNIDGAIFVMLKFCDPHAFDFPFLKDHLEQAGIPSLRLEIEDPQLAFGQLQTRIEAFVEML